MIEEPFVSIIIPCREFDKFTRECIKHCLDLNYSNYEIIVLPDNAPNDKDIKKAKSRRLRIIPTQVVFPAVKRNIGMKKAKGKIYAFIDADAYPDKDWLKNAIKYLKRNDVALVGGPNLTPRSDNFKQKISGILLSIWFCSGRAAIRYKKAKEQKTLELPSCNFIVKSKYATEFESDLLTAEDTKFCFNIWKYGKNVLYAPDVIVYHHRRPVFIPYLKQIWIYARDVALLLKRKGQFSFSKLYYSVLSLFVICLLYTSPSPRD